METIIIKSKDREKTKVVLDFLKKEPHEGQSVPGTL